MRWLASLALLGTLIGSPSLGAQQPEQAGGRQIDHSAPPGYGRPREVPVFWLLGQSNAEGGSGGLWLSNPFNAGGRYRHLHDQPLVQIWWPGASTLRPGSRPGWEGYQTGFFAARNNASYFIVEGVFGVEASFGDAAVRALGEPIYVFKFTGVVALHPDHPQTFSKRADRETRYDAMLAEWTRAASALRAQRMIPDVRGVLWVHGEADLRPGRNYAAHYAANLTRFAGDVRDDIRRLEPDNGPVRFVVAEMHDRHVPSNQYDPNEAVLRAQQISFVRASPNAALADVDDLSLDLSSPAYVHFDALGVIRLGSRMFEVWSDTDRGW